MCNNPNCPTCSAVKALQSGDGNPLEHIKKLAKGTPLEGLLNSASHIEVVPVPLNIQKVFAQLQEAMDNPCNCEHCVAARKQALAAGGQAAMLESRENCMPQVDALMDAGWVFQLSPNNSNPEPWQWQWRRPAKRKGTKGRLYLSTQQAYNALMRERSP